MNHWKERKRNDGLTSDKEIGSDVILGQRLVCKTNKISIVHFHVDCRNISTFSERTCTNHFILFVKGRMKLALHVYLYEQKTIRYRTWLMPDKWRSFALSQVACDVARSNKVKNNRKSTCNRIIFFAFVVLLDFQIDKDYCFQGTYNKSYGFNTSVEGLTNMPRI